MKEKTKTVRVLTCKKCKHEWQPRTKNPIQCSKCKSPNWMKKGKVTKK